MVKPITHGTCFYCGLYFEGIEYHQPVCKANRKLARRTLPWRARVNWPIVAVALADVAIWYAIVRLVKLALEVL